MKVYGINLNLIIKDI